MWEKIPKLNIAEQLKQDKEELVAAGMHKNDADPHPSGKFEERMKASDTDAAKRQEGIQKAAWELFRNRKALDPDNKETEPSEFDLRAAEAAFDAVQKQDKAEKPFYPPVAIADSGRERSVVPAKTDVYAAEPIPGESQQKVLEGASEKTIEDLRAELNASADEYKKARGQARGSRKYLAKLLGITKNVEKSEEVEAARLKYLAAKDAHRKAWRESAYKEYQEELESKKGTASEEELNQMKESLAAKLEAMAKYHNTIEDLNLQEGFIKETVEYYKTKGGPFGKVFSAYLDLYQNVYLKKVPPKVRAAISIAMMGGAVAGVAGAFGATGIFLGAASVVAKPARFLLAPLFPAMTYTGTGKMIEKAQQWSRAKKAEKKTAVAGGIIEKMKSGEVSVEDTMKNLDELLEKQGGEYGEELVKRGWTEDRCEQARNLLTIFVGARAAMVLMSGTEAISSFFEAKGNMAGALGASPKGALYTQGSGGKTSITPEGMKAIQNSGAGSPKITAEEYQKIRGHSYFSEPDAKMNDMRAPDAHAQMAELGNHELGVSKIYSGGGIERSAQDIIKANPKAFGLNPDSPQFHSQIGARAHQLAEDLRARLGMDKSLFNDLASHKVQENEIVKIFEDPKTGKPMLSYEGKAFGNRMLTGDARYGAAQEIAPSKGSIPVDDVKPKVGTIPEDVKPRTGAVDHQPSRAGSATVEQSIKGGHVNATQEIVPGQKVTQDYLNKVAQADQELAARHPEEFAANARKLAMDNHKLYLANRPLLENIFHKFGISDYYNIYDQPMSKWDTLIGSGHDVAQDVSQADAINSSNEAWDKLNDLHGMLKYYNTSGHESIGECLRRALADPRIGRFGHGESIGTVVQRAINEILSIKK